MTMYTLKRKADILENIPRSTERKIKLKYGELDIQSRHAHSQPLQTIQ